MTMYKYIVHVDKIHPKNRYIISDELLNNNIKFKIIVGNPRQVTDLSSSRIITRYNIITYCFINEADALAFKLKYT